MADKNSKNVGQSASVTIGGKKFKTTEIQNAAGQTKEVRAVTGTENAPRDISKVLQNEAGTIKTNSSFIAQSPAPSAIPNAQTSAPRPTASTIQTASMQAQVAQERAKDHTSYYNSNNAKTSSDMGLTHEHNSIPQSTQGIKTGGNSPVSSMPSSPLPKNPVSSEETTESRRSTPNIVAGKVATQGTSMGAAYYTTLAAGRHNAMSSNIDTSNVKTGSMLEKASIARAEQAAIKGSYSASQILRNTGYEAKASFYEAMASYSKNGITLSQSAKQHFSSIGGAVVGKTQGAFSSHDDMGNQIAGGTIGASIAGYTTFKAAQAVSPFVINAVKDLPTTAGKVAAVGKGAWDISTTAGKATMTLVRTASAMSSGFIPFSMQLTKAQLLHQAQITGLLHTATSHRIISGVQAIRTATVNTAQGLKTGVVTATNAAKNTVTLVRGMVNGSVMTSAVAHKALQNMGNMGLKSLKMGTKAIGQGVARGAVKGGVWAFKRGLTQGIKGLKTSTLGIGGMLASSDDMMISGVGNAAMLTTYGLQTSVVAGKVTGRVIKTSVKGGIGAAKGTYNAVAFIRQKGLRAAWARARNKVASAVANAGKSAISAIVNLVKGVGTKVVVPIIIIVIAVSAFMSVLSAPTVAIGGIFSGLFDTKNEDGTYTETDIRQFLTDPSFGIPALRTGYINDLYAEMQSNLKENGGGYHFVRFKTNTQDEVIEPTIAGISSVFYTEDDLCNIIQPIFNAVILNKYELAPTDAEAKAVLNEIFNKLFRKDYVSTVEHCGQDHTDGSGTPTVHSCGSIHAFDDCPNKLTGTHGSFTCTSCCYHYCDGHDDEDGNTSYCSGCKFACSGYSNCGGHDVLTITLNMDGLYQLLFEYFEQPIDNLSNIANRTEEQEKELSNLKDAYEICLEYINQVARQYGGGMTMDDLSGVVFINGSRVGNQAVVDLALSQVGNVGGQPYWSWYGFSSRVEWCACFVSWCMFNNGHGEVRYSHCQTGGVPYFQSQGRWANGGFTDLVAGDVIFFDWNGDGKAQHTGIVIGTDGTEVYTVEGNSGDVCKIKRYNLNSSVILGYGLMNY